MELPNKANAFVPPRKITEYLLSEFHTVGKTKSKFFRGIGFEESNSDLLVQELIQIAQNYNVNEVIENLFGTKYVIEGELRTPNGVTVKIRTVWIIEQEETVPRFVTAYPLD